MKTIAEIKEMVRDWLNDDEACLDRLTQIYQEECFFLERAGAAGKDPEAMKLYDELEARLENEHAEISEQGGN